MTPTHVQRLLTGGSFVGESKNVYLIRWSDRGDSFIVLDEDEFAKTLIPEIFKHNKYISFVRQLNAYGFHKRVGLSDNSMRASERKNKGPSEYYHPYFMRGHPNLLWLINKSGGVSSQKKGKGARVRTEDGLGGESDGEGRDAVEDNYGQNSMLSIPRETSAVPEAGSLQRCDMAIVLHQLQEIQKQQGEISRTVSRLRNDHNQLYQQAAGFQTLHDQHGSSINAILTFLATLCNRGLDGQGGQNIAQMFANAIPHDQQQGNVVDIGDVDDQQQQQNLGNLSPHRMAQRLLMAPPVAGPPTPWIQSPISEGQFQNALGQSGPGSRPGAIEELSETTQSDSPQAKVGPHNIMNIINSSNGQVSRLGAKSMTFPDLLKHCKNANSISPLTSEQRNNMLQLIAGTSAAESNNTLVSPHPAPPGLEQLRYTQAGIGELVCMQHDQETNLGEVSAPIQPPSPSGSIPIPDNGIYFPDAHVSHFDENFNRDAFLDTANGDGGGYTYDDFLDGVMGGNSSFDSGFDFRLDVNGTGESERMVETGGSNSGGCRSEMRDDTHTGSIPRPVKKKRKT
jgi:heat shock transcription factor, other eukaryote